MKPRKELRDVDRTFIQAVMLQCGILPMEKTTLDMRRALAQLSPEEALILRRKFRKIWRRVMQDEIGANSKKKETLEKIAVKNTVLVSMSPAGQNGMQENN